MSEAQQILRRMRTGVPGFDGIVCGGLPDLSLNIIMGRPGTGKTILTHQIIFNNLGEEGSALYLTTLAEPAVKMLRYLQQFSFVEPEKVGQQLHYVDVGEIMREQGVGGVNTYLKEMVRRLKPSLIGVDSFKAIHGLIRNESEMRTFAFELAVNLSTWGVTAFLVGEYGEQDIADEPIFTVADSIIRLYSETRGMHYHRYLNISKLRGSDFFGGLHPYTISEEGLHIYPRMKAPDQVPTSVNGRQQRIACGVDVLDEMLGGGVPVGSASMVAGGAGTGKTLLGLHFIMSAAERGEPGVILSFQETPAQFVQIAQGFGWDLPSLVEKGLVHYIYRSPVEIQPDILFGRVRNAVQQSQARVVLVDSLKDLEIATPDKTRYKDYIYSLVNELKVAGVTVILTNEIPELFGNFQLSEYGVSFIADNVILLRYVELSGKMSRAVHILKMRGSQHSKEIREFEITSSGMRVLRPITSYSGVLTGMPTASEQTLVHLPARARYVLDALRSDGLVTLTQLSSHTGLKQEEVGQELNLLMQQGLVIRLDKEGDAFFRATI